MGDVMDCDRVEREFVHASTQTGDKISREGRGRQRGTYGICKPVEDETRDHVTYASRLNGILGLGNHPIRGYIFHHFPDLALITGRKFGDESLDCGGTSHGIERSWEQGALLGYRRRHLNAKEGMGAR